MGTLKWKHEELVKEVVLPITYNTDQGKKKKRKKFKIKLIRNKDKNYSG